MNEKKDRKRNSSNRINKDSVFKFSNKINRNSSSKK